MTGKSLALIPKPEFVTAKEGVEWWTVSTLWLNDAKVVKYFGTRPWLGRRVKIGSTQVTEGNTPYKNVFGKEVFDKNVLVDVIIALKKAKGAGFWDVYVNSAFREKAEWWLIDLCR